MMTSIPKQVTKLAARAQALREETEAHSLLEDIVRFWTEHQIHQDPSEANNE